MRAHILALVLTLAAAPAFALTVIPPEDCAKRLGETVTIESTVSEVHHAASGRATFIDMGGRYPNNTFAAVIFKDDADKRAWPGLSASEIRDCAAKFASDFVSLSRGYAD
jgi:hypothetical protein